MNLWFRMLRVFWKSFFCSKIDVFDECRISFRVWPLDCDMNLHMNNGRYLTLMDLGRTYLMAQLGMLWQLPKNKWFPVVGAVEIKYMKSVDPFQKFDLVTKLLTWDGKWFYLEQRFERAGVVHARAVLRALFLGPKGRVASEALIKLVLDEIPEPPKHEVTDFWKDDRTPSAEVKTQ